MAFKKGSTSTVLPDNPVKLFHDLRRGTVQNLWAHQTELLRSYMERGSTAPDIALQLPTGSGKTLVGLLIAEWCRRRNNERVVYLCPTRQLVNQVVDQAVGRYGISVLGFTGSQRDYPNPDKAAYQAGEAIAVTTYSSLFNTNPFFDNADVVVIDDAHAAESYIANMWSIRIERTKPEHSTLHAAFCGLLKPGMDPINFKRLTGGCSGPGDLEWVDKIPTPHLVEKEHEISEILDEHTTNLDLKYPWSKIKGHLAACHLFLSPKEILLRPLIPPTWTHPPFLKPRQRVYMSATLGLGGDLERIVGRPNIARLPIPKDWDNQGVGRRFFIFPEVSLGESEALDLRHQLMERAGRSLVLVPSGPAQDEVLEDIKESLKFQTFTARDIEESKAEFISAKNAVAVVAGRYDGIDFPENECRLLFIDGLPRAANTQERFLMTKMGAAILLNERVQTRVIQAIGRCTRSSKDFSAVVVSGEDLTRYLTDKNRIPFLVPELQAELKFGIDQSKASSEDILENFDTFLSHDDDWEDVDNQIVGDRDSRSQKPFPATDELGAAVTHEIAFQEKMWRVDYEAALGCAENVLGHLTHTDLRGYRALWHYLAGSAAHLAAKEDKGLASKARAHFKMAKDASYGISWLVLLSRAQEDHEESRQENVTLLEQLERLESVLFKLGTVHDRAFAAREREILDGLGSNDNFENAQKLLGELLGFDAGKVESDGSPDPWWIAGNHCVVFEDYAGALDTSALDVTKARQTSSHPAWIKANVPECMNSDILPVLVTPVSKVKVGALPHLNGVALWPLEEFRSWSRNAISVVRDLRSTFIEPGNFEWRMRAAEAFEGAKMDMPGLVKMLRARPASDGLKPVK